jgi:hypothetical protein
MKLSTIVLAATLAFGLALPAFAQATAPGGTPTIPTPEPGCQVNCDSGDIAEPGDPFVPPKPECQINCNPPIPDPDPKPSEPDEGLTTGDAAQLRACMNKLSSLAEVSAAQISKLSTPSKVSLFPICEAKSLAQVAPVLVDKGNAYGLEGVIKRNELLLGKLKATRYKPHDVVGIEFDAKGNALLYVHKRG